MFSVPLHLRCCICQHTLDNLTNVPQEQILCPDCSKDAKSLIVLARKLEDVGNGTNRPFVNVMSTLMKMKGKESDFNKKISAMDKNIVFMRGSLSAIKDQIQCDVELKPGCNGPSKPACKALLASKSETFKNMLASDDVKAQSDLIMLAELNSDELESLIEFLYLGNLPEEKLEKHASTLFVAAHKYEISYLVEVCTSHLQASLSKANAFDILEISDACLNKSLKIASTSYILNNMKEVVLSDKYESFVLKNPSLCLEVTREFVAKKHKEQRGMVSVTLGQESDREDQIAERNKREIQIAELMELGVPNENMTYFPSLMHEDLSSALESLLVLPAE